MLTLITISRSNSVETFTSSCTSIWYKIFLFIQFCLSLAIASLKKSLGVFVLLIKDETTLRLRQSFADTIIPLLWCTYIEMWPFLILSEIFIIFRFIRNLLRRLVPVVSYSHSDLGVKKRTWNAKRWIIFQISASSGFQRGSKSSVPIVDFDISGMNKSVEVYLLSSAF